MMKICIKTGCKKQCLARSLCNMHYRRLQRIGLPKDGRNDSRTHGMTNTPTFKTWQAIIARCERPSNNSYKYYGAKGIKICERWRLDFTYFLADMGERPSGMTIDRIDSTKNYYPENCRWATITQQNNNKSDTRIIKFNGKSMSMTAWAKEKGMSKETLHYRITKMKLSINEALSIPVTRYARQLRFKKEIHQ